MKHIAHFCVGCLMACCFITIGRATVYYVSSSGNDANSGLSTSAAWRSPTRVNSQTLATGDQVLFEGGTTFTGSVIVASPDTSSAANPLVFTSYGTGRATINGGTTNGFYATNRAGIVVSNLNFIGSGSLTSTGNGIYFLNNGGSPNLLDYVRVDQVDVGGFNRGIYFYGNTTTNGFRDVRITNASVHDNARSGIESYALARMHTNFYVGWCRVWNTTGVTGASSHTGDGIILGNINTALIERCVAWTNSWIGNGAVGIWCWDAKGVTIQFCESHHNGTSGANDGDGFDLDGGVTDSIMQYNYSHDNAGTGYGIFQYKGAAPYSNNVVRYNISQNDGRLNGYGSISLWNGNGSVGVEDVDVYNNTLFMSPAPSGAPSGIQFLTAVANCRFWNNCIITTGGVSLVVSSASQPTVQFQGNNYWSSSNTFAIKWGKKTYATLAAWQTGSGEEEVGTTNVGYSVNPQLVNPGGGGTLGDASLLTTLTAYREQPYSAMCEAGLNLAALFGLNVGPIDFYGDSVPNGLAPDIGADDERIPVILSASAIQAGYFTTTYLRGYPERTNLIYTAETSTNLVNWSSAGVVPVLTNNLGNGTEWVQLRGTLPASAADHNFMRLQVTFQP